MEDSIHYVPTRASSGGDKFPIYSRRELHPPSCSFLSEIYINYHFEIIIGSFEGRKYFGIQHCEHGRGWCKDVVDSMMRIAQIKWQIRCRDIDHELNVYLYLSSLGFRVDERSHFLSWGQCSVMNEKRRRSVMLNGSSKGLVNLIRAH